MTAHDERVTHVRKAIENLLGLAEGEAAEPSFLFPDHDVRRQFWTKDVVRKLVGLGLVGADGSGRTRAYYPIDRTELEKLVGDAALLASLVPDPALPAPALASEPVLAPSPPPSPESSAADLALKTAEETDPAEVIARHLGRMVDVLEVMKEDIRKLEKREPDGGVDGALVESVLLSHTTQMNKRFDAFEARLEKLDAFELRLERLDSDLMSTAAHRIISMQASLENRLSASFEAVIEKLVHLDKESDAGSKEVLKNLDKMIHAVGVWTEALKNLEKKVKRLFDHIADLTEMINLMGKFLVSKREDQEIERLARGTNLGILSAMKPEDKP